MAKVALQGGAYSARSLLASAQRCVGLYAERNPPDAVFPFTYYPMPGLTKLASPPTAGEGRGLFRMSDGRVYSLVGANLYEVGSNFSHNLIGSIGTSTGIGSMRDNGISAVLVDGSSLGYAFGFTAGANFVPINDGDSGAFYGANRVDYLDTFYIFNKPATNQFYISLSEVNQSNLIGGPLVAGIITNGGSGYTDGTYSSINMDAGDGQATADIVISGGVVRTVTIITGGSDYMVGNQSTNAAGQMGTTGSGFTYQVTEVGSSAFDQLDIAAKAGYPDAIQTFIVMHGELWLLGRYTTEVWYDSGAADFAFQRMPGVFIEHGTCAPNSLARQDLTVYFLSQDPEGRSLVLAGNNYAVAAVSTRALEAEIATYSRVDDAIGWCWQLNGHVFYQLTFPTAHIDQNGVITGRTWLYDISTETWLERPWLDSDGVEQRWRVHTGCMAYDKVIGQDWETGDLYEVDLAAFTDDGSPIKRLRSWAHIADSGERLTFNRFQLAMETGGAGTSVGQINVDSPGDGYIAAPAVIISGGGGRNATAVAQIAFTLSGLTLTSPGSGYVTTPTVVFTGGNGSGATATATLGSVVSSVAITAAGSGYSTPPSVAFTGGGGSGVSGQAKLAMSVTGATTTAGGAGYSSAPTVTFSGDGTGASATAALAGGPVSSLTLTNAGSGYTSNPSVSITGGGGSGATAAASSGGGGVTAINVTAGGSYTGVPSVSITGGGGSGASATAVVSGAVVSVTVDDGGMGYGSSPTVTFSGGGGNGAIAYANVAGGQVRSITITNSGSGYTSAPAVILNGGQGRTGEFSSADAYATLGGSVQSVNITNPGSGYTSPPTIAFSGNGSGAAATATVGSSAIVIALTSGGSGYTSTPSVSITGGGGSGATAVAAINSPVGALTITNPGSGYSTAPTIAFSGGGGTGAAATAQAAGGVASVAITSPGGGYTSAPAVSFTGGGGTGAAGTAQVSTGIASLTLTSMGSGYDYAPTISFVGGGGMNASATAQVIGSVTEVDIVNPGSGYTSAPTVTLAGDALASASLYQKDAAQVALRWSDTQGRTYGSALTRSFGPEGAYNTSLLWTRLGMGRDRVFEVSWSAPVETALLGAYIDVASSAS